MPSALPRLVLVGHPNVGKSQLFNCLTGGQAVVSNYPGTTVELARGRGNLEGKVIEVIDSPGLYSLSALSTEERVTRLLLLREKPALVIQVIDARNLRRMLSLTLELLEAELPLVVALNMMDEARAAGMLFNLELLSRRLGVPVIPTVLVTGSGLQQLCRAAKEAIPGGRTAPGVLLQPVYPPAFEKALASLAESLHCGYGLSRRSAALTLLHPDHELEAEIKKREGIEAGQIPALRLLRQQKDPLMLLATERRRHTDTLLKGVVRHPAHEPYSFSERLSRLLLSPIAGSCILCLVLYFGFYCFVGRFGAGILVEFLEERLFLRLLAPRLNLWAELYLPWSWLRELLVMEYGVLTLGVRYAFTIILPILATFFLFFSLIEDSGYLPRAAYLMNFIMEKLGLNGKAIIPLTLGLGCGTLAVLVTRTLDTRRERLQASLLLSLAVPCSAQLGLILALLSGFKGLIIWLCIVMLAFFGAALAGRALFGRDAAPFCLEIPPLRMPRLGTILRKTAARLRWYLREVLPLFIGISCAVWLLRLSGLLDYLVRALAPLAASLGLPDETVLIFVFGFLRRDYGAAGLFDLARGGVLSHGQILVSAVFLTLFLPCVAQLAVLTREYGPRFALMVGGMTALTAWAAGMLTYLITGIPFIARMLG